MKIVMFMRARCGNLCDSFSASLGELPFAMRTADSATL
ncbi:MAG: hypothetical protein OJF58_002387 [Enhydrobacter sp.]|nr:MAG: hypothetical protein OJF58_002387 [Enhydrobacter sp.]